MRREKHISWSIYILKDPRTMEVRYVGWTVDTRKRFKGHLVAARLGKDRTHKANWIRSLLRDDLEHMMEIVETGSGDPAPAEIAWIAKMRQQGYRLTNRTDGGDGTTGMQVSEATRKRLSESHKGHKATVSQREAMSRAHRALPMTPERLDRLQRQVDAMRQKRTAESFAAQASSLRGRKHSAAHRLKISIAGKGRQWSEEAREKASIVARARVQTAEGRQQILAAVQKAVVTPRDPVAESIRRKKISLAVKARWADPEQRLKMEQGIQRAWDQRISGECHG